MSLPYFPSHSHASTVLDIEVNRYMNNINKSGFTPRFLVRFKLLIFLVSCFSCFALFVFVLCLVYPMLPVSMDCPFLIVPLRFSVTFLYYLHCMCIKYKGTLRLDHDWIISVFDKHRLRRIFCQCVYHHPWNNVISNTRLCLFTGFVIDRVN